MSDIPEFYHYLEVVGHKYEQNTRNWILWGLDEGVEEGEELP